MNATRDLLFCLFCNSVIQISIFAIAAALLVPMLKRVRPAHQHVVYLAVLFLCLVAPIVNTLRHPASKTSSSHVRGNEIAAGSSTPGTGAPWLWTGHFMMDDARFRPGPETENFVLAVWLTLALYGLVRLGMSLLRVRELRSSSYPVCISDRASWGSIGTSSRVLQSEVLKTPVTVGLLRPVIIIPSELLSEVSEYESKVLIAHEDAHIRRHDFVVQLIVQILTIPVTWHPGMRYLAMRISQTRELACDEDAAAQLGKRRSYARALLRLSSLCAGHTNSNAVQVGVFDGNNLEERIMMLMKRNGSISRRALATLLVAAAITFGSGAILARAASLQSSQGQVSAQLFAGTWHWMVRGQSFATMILIPSGEGLSGSVTQSHIGLAGDGSLDMADPVPNAAPAEISEANVTGSVLHVKTKDGFAFSVTLTDSTHASIQPLGAPPNMKPILAEKAK